MNNSNRGMTIIEILISVGIIGMVLIFLFNMLVQVRQEDEQNNVQSNFIINQSSFIRTISEDIANYGLIGISECGNDFGDNLVSDMTLADSDNYLCIRFEYGKGYVKDRIGYLILYKYFTKYDNDALTLQGSEAEWMIKYSRGYYRSCDPNTKKYYYWEETSRLGKEMPADVDLGEGVEVRYTAQGSTALNAASIVMPVIDVAGNHYDIALSFLFKGNDNFYCSSGSSTGKDAIKCNCLSDAALCKNTLEKTFSYQCDY